MKKLIFTMSIGLLFFNCSSGDKPNNDDSDQNNKIDNTTISNSSNSINNLDDVKRPNSSNQAIGYYKGMPANGIFSNYYSNGNLKHKMEFKDGYGKGQDIQYYPNGNQKSITYRVNGWPNGTLIFFYENGNIKSKCNFDGSGVRQGDAQWYNPDGSIKGNGLYSKNTLVKCSGNCS